MTMDWQRGFVIQHEIETDKELIRLRAEVERLEKLVELLFDWGREHERWRFYLHGHRLWLHGYIKRRGKKVGAKPKPAEQLKKRRKRERRRQARLEAAAAEAARGTSVQIRREINVTVAIDKPKKNRRQ
jgi:transposase